MVFIGDPNLDNALLLLPANTPTDWTSGSAGGNVISTQPNANYGSAHSNPLQYSGVLSWTRKTTPSEFDEPSGSVDIGTTLDNAFVNGPFTMMAWCRWTETGILVTAGHDAGGYNGCFFTFDSEIRAGSPSNAIATGIVPAIGQWYHCALVGIAPGANNLITYVNGVRRTSGTFATHNSGGPPSSFRGGKLYFGSMCERYSGYPSAGSIADFRIYDKVLSDEEIAFYASTSGLALGFLNASDFNRFITGDAIVQDNGAANANVSGIDIEAATLSLYNSTGSWGPANTGRYAIGPIRGGRKFYDEINQTVITEKELIAKYGMRTADNRLGIYELTEQPVYQVSGYEKVGNKYKPLRSYREDIDLYADYVRQYIDYLEAAACPWSESETYTEGNIVKYNDLYYQALSSGVATSSNSPELSDVTWTRITIDQLEDIDYSVGTTTAAAPEPTPEPTSSPIAVNGYYPLYTSEADANAAGNGTSHSHTFNGVTYYMPNGVTYYHGNYGSSGY